MSDPGHPPPAYGPPQGYGPGYGLPGYAPYPVYGAPTNAAYLAPPTNAAYLAPPTNPMAIAALACALTVAPVGLGLGIAARKQIRRSGERGDGLALAAIIIGGLVTGIYVLLLVVLVIAWIALLDTGFGP